MQKLALRGLTTLVVLVVIANLRGQNADRRKSGR